MNQQIRFRYKEIDLVWYGWCMLCKNNNFKPLKLSYNGTAGWWISSKIFFSVNQLKENLKNK